jgi:hypothetical protein
MFISFIRIDFIGLNFSLFISIKLGDEKDCCTTVVFVSSSQKSYRKQKFAYFASTGSHKPFYDASEHGSNVSPLSQFVGFSTLLLNATN